MQVHNDEKPLSVCPSVRLSVRPSVRLISGCDIVRRAIRVPVLLVPVRSSQPDQSQYFELRRPGD